MTAVRHDSLFLIVLSAALAFLFCADLYHAGNVELTVWGDRDLWRALAVPQHWPFLGPETNSGARTPGGAFYLLLAALLAIKADILAANLGVIGLFGISAVLLWRCFAKEVSPLAGALVTAAFAGSGTLAQSLTVWNPGYIVVFATAATLWGYLFVSRGRAMHLAAAALALGLGMQIHMQIFELAIGLVIAIGVYRPRLRRQHVMALVAGSGAAYLPAILFGGGRFFTEATAAPGEAAAAYIYWSGALWQKARFVYDLFGGSARVFAERGGFAYAGVATALAAADFLAAALAGGFLVRLIVRRSEQGQPRPLGLFAIITLVYAAVALVSEVNFRHMAAAIPAVSVMVGLSAEAAIQRLLAGGNGGRAAAAALCGLIALRPAALGAAGFLQTGFFTDSAVAQEEIARTLKSAFFSSYQAFEARTALFQRDANNRWRLIQSGVGNHMAFIYRATPAAATPPGRHDCVLVVDKRGADGNLRSELAATPALAQLAPVFDTATVESPHFLYLSYASRDGNCLKTFPNPYVPTVFETTYLAAGSGSAAVKAPQAAIFVVPQQGHLFPLGIEVRRDGQSFTAVLHGRLLRGYSGLYYRTIVAPRLCFVGRSGSRLVSFGNVTVGSPWHGTLAPWRSPVFTLADNAYEVWLIGREGREPGSIDRPIGRLSLPDMTPALPQGEAARTAPTSCFPDQGAGRDG